jgi:hypothetical protein
MKIWRSGSQFVVEQGDAFLVIDATGAITKRFEPSSWSIEDELGEIHFTVNGKVLWEHKKVQFWGRDESVDDRAALDDLVPDTSAETLRFIATALGDAAVVREEKRIADQRAADARLAAIPGARDDHQLGELFARAQHALADRVHTYAHDLSAALLQVLVELGRARAYAPALHAFACGCLHAAFAYDVPELEEAEPAPAPALAARIRPLVTLLEQAAESQEWVDANLNAAAYWRAAKAVSEAARLLGG